MKNIAILGSTGSIGKNTLNVVRNNPSELSVKALTANSNWRLLAEQALEFSPQLVVIGNKNYQEPLAEKLKDKDIKVFSGYEAIIEAAEIKSADTIVSAIVGSAGLEPALNAIIHKKDLCLANKETLVVGGKFVIEAVKKAGVALIPIDSEHSAIFQCIGSNNAKLENVRKLIITASGGPFRTWEKERIENVSLEQALKHPNWSMGGKITIDSATLMNKGLEVIEAHWLFDINFDDIDVVVHPQSIIHSLIEYSDGSVIAQLGWPDMKLPIQYALSYPNRWEPVVERLDLVKVSSITFEAPKFEIFPCLKYAYEAGKMGEGMPCVLNAANEIAVSAFMQKQIGFTDIAKVIKRCMDEIGLKTIPTIKDLLELDKISRNHAQQIVSKTGEIN